MKKSLYFFGLLLFVTTLSFAQTDQALLTEKYAQEKRVLLKKQETYKITLRNNEPFVTKHYVEKNLIIDPSVSSNGSADIVFNDFSKIYNVQGLTEIGKKKVRVDMEKDAQTNDIMLENIFYSDYKKTTIHFKRLEKGATTTLEYKEEYKRPRMLPSFTVGGRTPTVSTELKLIVSPKVKLGYKIFNDENEIIKVTETQVGNEMVYTFRAKNLDKMKYERGAPDFAYVVPHVIFYIKGYEGKDGYQSFLESDKDLFNWYASLVKGINKTDETELKEITSELIKGKTTEADKAEVIFNWVQQKIRYIAFEDGMGGFVPRESADVCTKRYGDCKDMANILTQMMKYAGLKSHLVWIGTRSRPYSYKEVPTPLVDNHMIASVEIDDKVIFLDATGQYVPFGYPTPFIQGKEAMVDFGETHKIIKVEEVSGIRNLNKNIVNIAIEGDVLKCNATKELHGYSKMYFLHSYGSYHNGDKNFWKNYLEIGNNKFRLIEETHEENTYSSDPTMLNYQFTLESYVRKIGNRIFINPNLRKTSLDVIDLEDRESDYTFRFNRQYDIQYNISIPEGYEVSKLPKSSEMNTEWAGYSIKYGQEGDVITVDVSTFGDYLTIKKDNLEAYNEVVKSLKKAQKKNIILVKKK
jgi:transglutaminase-like putative cysteine protease